MINRIKQIELDSKVPVRAIRSDNGTEFKNKTLIQFCSEKGITRQYSAPRTPQKNGIVCDGPTIPTNNTNNNNCKAG